MNFAKLKYSILLLVTLILMQSCNVIDEIKKDLYVKISTDNINQFTYTVAIVGGNVSDDGGKPITERGICYSKTPGPTTGNSKITSGAGTGIFSTTIFNLEPNTTYYFKAYCINAYGTAYGNEVNIKTPDYILSTFPNPPISNSISENYIDLSGSVNEVGVSIKDYGFCYSESPNPTITNSRTTPSDLKSSNFGKPVWGFSGRISGLKSNTTYYIRTFCTNLKGTSYSDQIVVKTLRSYIEIGLNSGLEVFYPFEGNANNATLNKYNGIVSGAVLTSDRYNNNNSAYLFRGSSKITTDYFGISGYNSRSISLWFKIAPNTIGNHSHILSYGGNPFNNESMLSIFVSSLGANKPYVGLMSNGYVGNQFANIQDNQWHHLVITSSSIDLGKLVSTKMYIDGYYVNYDVFYNAAIFNTVKNLPLVIGQFTSLDSDPRNFGGSLDDIGIWNRVLSENEIQYLFLNNFKPSN